MEIGERFQHTFNVTEQINRQFRVLFKDENPLHTNLDFARSKGFSNKVMYGNILNGFLSFFIGEGLPSKEVMIIAQSINYHAPFFVGDTLRLEAIVKEVSLIVRVKLVKFSYKFFNQQDKLIAKGKIEIKQL